MMNRPFHVTQIFGLLSLSFLLYLASAANYVPTDEIRLDCGGPPASADTDGLIWISDVGSKFAANGKSSTATAAEQKPSVAAIPYMTARIFQSNFTYSFPVVPGHKFIRLHFYPETYNNFTAAGALFAVTSGRYTLLYNFSAQQTAEALNYDYIMKEYSINVQSVTVDIVFSPAPNSYAFINGIEIVSHPDIYNTETGQALILGTSVPFFITNDTVLENILRLNVGGNGISPTNDTGLYRAWADDSSYLFGAGFGVTMIADQDVNIAFLNGTPTYVAPLDVYKTYRSMGPSSVTNMQSNLTWLFTIESGFNYLVRLHFCEVIDNANKVNQRVFDIYMNNKIGYEGADVISWGGGKNGVPVYKDFIVPTSKGSPRQDLWLSLHPNPTTKPGYYDAILNGMEIFKISPTHQ